jgi:DUF2911 family protein/tetratricopeptide repeat protein
MNVRAILLPVSLAVAVSAAAQAPIRLPDLSPAAVAGQTVGVTDIQINYHRPAVNKRKIWGGLVPYGVMWRAGANENTTISFSTPVKVEGQSLPAGTYGLFMIPTATQWTVVFSNFTGDWGAYNYEQSEDAARVTVTPQTTSDSEERLAYTFDDLTPSSVVASLRWEKLRVPLKIETDLLSTVRASIRNELRGGKHWSSDAYVAAARFELRNGDPDTALKYVDRALSLRTTGNALRTKANIVEKKGDKKEAAALRDRANQINSEAETLNATAFDLTGEKKYDEAIAYLNNYLSSHPKTNQAWTIYSLIGQAYADKGDPASARASFDKALAAAHDMAERMEVEDYVSALGAKGQ